MVSKEEFKEYDQSDTASVDETEGSRERLNSGVFNTDLIIDETYIDTKVGSEEVKQVASHESKKNQLQLPEQSRISAFNGSSEIVTSANLKNDEELLRDQV